MADILDVFCFCSAVVNSTVKHRWSLDSIIIYGLTTLNKPKSRQVYTNDGIITQNIFNAAVSTSVELKKNTKKLYFCEYLIST